MVRTLVAGVGVNDADYNVSSRNKNSDGEKWECPYYVRWKCMLQRCYGNQKLNPTYVDCTVCDEWLIFSNFKSWMEGQDWEGKYLDKDILSFGNKVYSPETCVFVSNRVNNFIQERKKTNGLPIGLYWNKNSEKYKAACKDHEGRQTHLGYFDNPYEAHKAWIEAKLMYAKILASEEKDQRVAKALIERYENYQTSH